MAGRGALLWRLAAISLAVGAHAAPSPSPPPSTGPVAACVLMDSQRELLGSYNFTATCNECWETCSLKPNENGCWFMQWNSTVTAFPWRWPVYFSCPEQSLSTSEVGPPPPSLFGSPAPPKQAEGGDPVAPCVLESLAGVQLGAMTTTCEACYDACAETPFQGCYGMVFNGVALTPWRASKELVCSVLQP